MVQPLVDIEDEGGTGSLVKKPTPIFDEFCREKILSNIMILRRPKGLSEASRICVQDTVRTTAHLPVS